MSDIANRIAKLETQALALSSLLHRASRAFVIEFAGTPKSGKTTSVEAIRHFFSRNGFRVHVLVERASVCPIPMKGHLFFNTWCAATMLAELLANVDTETDIIIVDRGIFDALVWLSLQKRRGEITLDENQIIEEFLLLERWKSLIDLAVVMRVDPPLALDRENSQRITTKPGSIMNLEVLDSLSHAVTDALNAYGNHFPRVIDHDTSRGGVRESNALLAEKVINQLTLFLDPEILVVPTRELKKLPIHNGGCFDADCVQRLIKCIQHYGTDMKRSVAETDSTMTQIIASGVLTRSNKVFLFQRKERDPKYILYGKSTIWQGTHVPTKRDKRGLDLISSALMERISRSLYISRQFPIEPRGYCWDRDNPDNNRHFSVVFNVDIDNEHMAIDLQKKEFRKGRGHGMLGSFVEWDNLATADIEDSLEIWSKSILTHRKEFLGLRNMV